MKNRIPSDFIIRINKGVICIKICNEVSVVVSRRLKFAIELQSSEATANMIHIIITPF